MFCPQEACHFLRPPDEKPDNIFAKTLMLMCVLLSPMCPMLRPLLMMDCATALNFSSTASVLLLQPVMAH